MEELIIYAGYKEYKAALDSELARTAEGFVRIGYLLRLAADSDILKDSGYKNVLEFAQKEYGLDKSQVSRFIAINAKFSENGYSDRLETHYQGFGYAKLSIMLQLPEVVNEVLTPDFSKSEIQAVKNEIDEEMSISDLEMLTEDVGINMEAMDGLQKVLYQMGRENPELFVKLHNAKAAGPKEYQEILAPSGESLISVRIQGVGRMMLVVKDVEHDVALLNVRSGEKESCSWEKLVSDLNILTGRNVGNRPESGKKWWELVYSEAYPIAEKTEVAPVQQEPKTRKESKVTAAKPEPPKVEKKPEPKKPEPPKPEPPKPAPETIENGSYTAAEPKDPAETEPAKPEIPPEILPPPQTEPEKAEVAPVQPEKEGQLSVEDFPQYLPEGYTVEDKKEPKTSDYEIREMPAGEFALYEDGLLALVCYSKRNALLIKAIMKKDCELDPDFTEEDFAEFLKESEESR